LQLRRADLEQRGQPGTQPRLRLGLGPLPASHGRAFDVQRVGKIFLREAEGLTPLNKPDPLEVHNPHPRSPPLPGWRPDHECALVTAYDAAFSPHSMPKTALEPPLAPLVCCLRKDGASGRTHVCNGDGTGHLLDEHHAVGSAVLRRKSGYFDKTDELQK